MKLHYITRQNCAPERSPARGVMSLGLPSPWSSPSPGRTDVPQGYSHVTPAFAPTGARQARHRHAAGRQSADRPSLIQTGQLTRVVDAPMERTTAPRPQRLDPFKPVIHERLAAYPALSAVRLFAECRAHSRRPRASACTGPPDQRRRAPHAHTENSCAGIAQARESAGGAARA